jgi:myo-inositol-1(or 4)-monophosphatase
VGDVEKDTGSRAELLATALEVAHRAGEVLVERLGQRRTVVLKGYRDEVTDADTCAEAVALSLIRDRFPDHAILSEEAGRREAEGIHVWVVDPLDGTTNYARGHPTFSVSVAVMVRGDTVVGVVHDPLRGHTFAARRGGGVTLDGSPVRASRVGRLRDALIGLDWARSDADREDLLRRLAALAPRCRTVRTLGSAALAQSYVGAGWLDLYFARGLFPWDTAAASLIVVEAGGRITGLDGEPWGMEQPALLVTNGRLHEEVLALWGALG